MGSGTSKMDGIENTRIERFHADLIRRDSDGDQFMPQRVVRGGSFGSLGTTTTKPRSELERQKSHSLTPLKHRGTGSNAGTPLPRSVAMNVALEQDRSPLALSTAFSPAKVLHRTPPPSPKSAQKKFLATMQEGNSTKHILRGSTREAIIQQRNEERRRREREHRDNLLHLRREYFLQKLKTLQSTQDDYLDYRGQRYDHSELTYAKQNTLSEVLRRKAQRKEEKQLEEHALLAEYRRQYLLDRKRVLAFIQAENFVPNVLVYEWTHRPNRKKIVRAKKKFVRSGLKQASPVKGKPFKKPTLNTKRVARKMGRPKAHLSPLASRGASTLGIRASQRKPLRQRQRQKPVPKLKAKQRQTPPKPGSKGDQPRRKVSGVSGVSE